MIIDARTLGQDIVTDVCVIGSGAAGVSATLRLAAQGLDVVLLEAGGLSWSKAEQAHFVGEVADADRQPRLDLYRQRQFGGTTTVWGGRSAPYDEHEMVDRAYCGIDGWPLAPNALTEHLAVAQELLDLGDWNYAASAVPSEAMFPGVGWHQIEDRKIWRFSLPTNVGLKYRRKLRQSSGVRVLLHAPCIKLNDRVDGRIESATISPDPGRQLKILAQSYIVAAGALESTRLLMLSNGRRDGGLGNGYDQLGRYYMTHLYGVIGSLNYHGNPRRISYGYEKTTDGVYARRMLTVRPDVQARRGLMNFSVGLAQPNFYDPDHGSGVLSAVYIVKNLMRHRLPVEFRGKEGVHGFPLRHLSNLFSDSPATLAFAMRWVSTRMLSRRKLPGVQIYSRSGRYPLLYSAEQKPNAESRLRLAEARDAFGSQRLRSEWTYCEEDVQSILGNYDVLASDAAQAPLVDLLFSRDQLAEDVRHNAGVGSHHIGTTRMADSERRGVVDSDCRVFGSSNLFVASSSVFPTSSCMSPTLMIAAIGSYIATRVIEEIRQ